MTTPQDMFGDVYNDWHYALYEAHRGRCGSDKGLPVELGLADVIAAKEGENDGANWLAVFRLENGRYAYLSAGCDYTGWDCSASGTLDYADTLQELCRLYMGEDERQRLGFDVNGEKV